MVQRTMGTIMGSITTLFVHTQMTLTVTWAAETIPEKHVADRPCSICTNSRERIPSVPLSCQLPVGGAQKAATGTSWFISFIRMSIDCMESDSVQSRTLE